MRVDESNAIILQKAYEITGCINQVRWIEEENFIGEIDMYEVIDLMDELVSEYKRLEESYEDLQEDLRNNYEPKKINLYDEYGLNEKDFH